MFIRTANDTAGVQKAGGYKRFVELIVAKRWAGKARVDWAVSGVISAEIIRSNWVVRCPFCSGSQVIEPELPFYCVDCMNGANGGQAMLIVMPDDRLAIERALVKRHDPNTRNWLIGETLGDLLAENYDNGLRD